MNYHDITTFDMKNGEGLRVVLWLSGCEHACEGCQNPVTWDPYDGLCFDDNAKAELFEKLDKDYISGITLSGGDPFFVGNREEVLSLLKEISLKFPQKTIWCYTGYEYDEIKTLEAMQYIDVLIDGKYDKTRADNTLYWRGSSNQRVIDVKNSIKLDSIVILYGGK